MHGQQELAAGSYGMLVGPRRGKLQLSPTVKLWSTNGSSMHDGPLTAACMKRAPRISITDAKCR